MLYAINMLAFKKKNAKEKCKELLYERQMVSKMSLQEQCEI